MKITFIYPDLIYSHIPGWSGTYYVGIGYMTSVLKQTGHIVSLLHITQPIREEDFKNQLENLAPDLIAFSSTTNMFPAVQQYSACAKRYFPKVLCICGGTHPTLNPAEVISEPNIDILCRGEGEEALSKLCNCLEKGEDYTKVKNLWIKKDGEI